MDRPSTSKPRGVCRYYTHPRGCFAGKTCKFLHGEPANENLTPYDKAKTCKYYANGYCKRGADCWFIHSAPPQPIASSSSTALQPEQDVSDDVCCICFEKPTTYGLLAGCSHVFCNQCIRQWRNPNGKSVDVVYSGVTKKCPMCRAASKFVTPSSRFFPAAHPGKDNSMRLYKESMGRVPCRYFQQSKVRHRDQPICPFGKDCFYQHLNDDGTPYAFDEGVDRCMRQYISRRGISSLPPFHFPFGFSGNISPNTRPRDLYITNLGREMLSMLLDNHMIDGIRAGFGGMNSRATDATWNSVGRNGGGGEDAGRAQRTGVSEQRSWNASEEELPWNATLTDGRDEAGEGVSVESWGSWEVDVSDDDELPSLEPLDANAHRTRGSAPRNRNPSDFLRDDGQHTSGVDSPNMPRVGPRGSGGVTEDGPHASETTTYARRRARSWERDNQLSLLQFIDVDTLLDVNPWGQDDEPDPPVPILIDDVMEGSRRLEVGDEDILSARIPEYEPDSPVPVLIGDIVAGHRSVENDVEDDEPPDLQPCSDSSSEDDEAMDEPPGLQSCSDSSEEEEQADELPDLQPCSDSSEEEVIGEPPDLTSCFDSSEEEEEEGDSVARRASPHLGSPATRSTSGDLASSNQGTSAGGSDLLSTTSSGATLADHNAAGLSSSSPERRSSRTRPVSAQANPGLGGTATGIGEGSESRGGRFAGVGGAQKMVIVVEDDESEDEGRDQVEKGRNERRDCEMREANLTGNTEPMACSMSFSMSDGQVGCSGGSCSSPSPGRPTQVQERSSLRVGQPEGEGFMTDGRGRVIGTSEQLEVTTSGTSTGAGDCDGEEGEDPCRPVGRSLFGRVFDAIFLL